MKKSAILPDNFVLNTWDDIKPYYDELISREINSIQELKQLISDCADLDSYAWEDFARRYIRKTCDTWNEDIKKHYELFINEIQPNLSKISDTLNKKIAGSELSSQLDNAYSIYLRWLQRDIELFREENIPLHQEIEILVSQYAEIISNMTIEHDGKELTLKQAEIFLKDTHRETRKIVRDKILARRRIDIEKIDQLLDKLILLRNKIALNCWFSDYATYMHYAKQRFDYTMEDVMNFHESIKTVISPLCKIIHEKRKNVLWYELKPYDFDISIYNKQSNVCYKDSKDLVVKTIDALNMTHSWFGDFIGRLSSLNQLDLDTRKWKWPWWYNYPMGTGDTSFIFMNASTDSYGLFTMLHECGHALHHFYTYGIEPSYQRYPWSEVCEIASMAQELLSIDKLSHFFENRHDYDISTLEKLEDDILMFSWISKIDLFQHWLYTNIGHTHEQRHQKWAELTQEYPYDIRTGMYESWVWEYQKDLGSNRQKQIHIFDYPFYYIEYAIASLAAIAMWRNYINDQDAWIENYISLLKVGNTKTMPDIFASWWISFDFSRPYVSELMNFMKQRMNVLYSSLSQ